MAQAEETRLPASPDFSMTKPLPIQIPGTPEKRKTSKVILPPSPTTSFQPRDHKHQLDMRLVRRHAEHVSVADASAAAAAGKLSPENSTSTQIQLAGQSDKSPTRHHSAASEAVRLRMAARDKHLGNLSIQAKQQALEKIMSQTAKEAQNETKQYKSRATQATRVAFNPKLISGLDESVMAQLSAQFPFDSDLSEALEETSDRLISGGGFQEAAAGEADGQTPAPGRELGSLLGSRIGFGFTGMGEKAAHGRVFASRCGKYVLAGVVNGHGDPEMAERLEHLVAEEMSGAVFRNSSLVHDHNAPVALRDALNRMHHRAVELLDVRLAGAACTVCLWDDETMWVASVGDCRAVLGVPDTSKSACDFHFAPLPLTKDHTLASPGEYDRVLSKGGEVRLTNGDGVYRIYWPTSDKPPGRTPTITRRVYAHSVNLPGLTLTRSVGDRFGHFVGVSHTPSIGSVNRSQLAGSFLILGSGGLWATMSDRLAVNWISNRFASASEAAESLAQEAFKRWGARDGRNPLPERVQDCFACSVVFFPTDPVAEPQARQALEPAAPHATTEDRLTLPAVGQTPRSPIAASPRSFLVGRGIGVQKAWEVVKSPDRADTMRRTQAHRQKLQAWQTMFQAPDAERRQADT